MWRILAGGYGLMATLLIFVIDVRTWLWVLVRGGAGCARVPPVSYGGFRKNFLFDVAAVALFALGNLDFAFAFVLSALVRCLGVAWGVQRMDFPGRLR